MRVTVRNVLAGAALLACALAVRAQQLPEALAQLNEDGRWVNGVTESWWLGGGVTQADAAGVAARWKEIGDELASAGAEGSAGDYFRVTEPAEGDTVVVLRAGENESEALVIREVNERGRDIYYDEETREKKHTKVVSGWKLTTSPR